MHTFDEELFGGYSENSELDLIQLSSVIPLNFMLISINGKVFKYDIVSKECMYEFNSHARFHMFLYDNDDKIVVADRI